jgi:small subunit ribosomal protein S1
VSGQNEDGQVTLSRRQLAIKQAWEALTEIADSGKSLQMRVTGSNKGGVIGEIEEIDGLRAFIPRSHLIQKDNFEALMGQLLTATVLELDQERNKLVLSQREAAKAAVVQNLQKGTLAQGRVSSIKPYGIFVDLEAGITGLLHIKQVSGTSIDSLTKIFQIGQTIQVVILEIDEFKNRISLSTKILEAYPGELLEKMGEVMENAAERLEQAQAQEANNKQ